MGVNIKKEEAEKIIRAVNLKRRIDELEWEMEGLRKEKMELEKEYKELGVTVEEGEV